MPMGTFSRPFARTINDSNPPYPWRCHSICEDHGDLSCFRGRDYPAVIAQHGITFIQEENAWIVIDEESYGWVQVGDYCLYPRVN